MSGLVVGLLRKQNAFAVFPPGNMNLPGDERLQELPSPLGMKRQITELRSGNCFVAENVMLMLLDISSEEEARLKPFFMLLQSL